MLSCGARRRPTRRRSKLLLAAIEAADADLAGRYSLRDQV